MSRAAETQVLKAVVTVNGQEYTLYSGFMSAAEINSVARVPNFPSDKPHLRIAADLESTPVDDWQRPPDLKKISAISQLYSDSSHNNLMPNPILLGRDDVGTGAGALCEVSEIAATSPRSHGLCLLTAKCSENDDPPLVILDGQHRVLGLARSTQKTQPVPFVLCMGPGFSGDKLAEIFTHVTTQASPMKPLHRNWMQYAFGLDPYDSPGLRRAVESVIKLCVVGNFEGVPNPFQDRVRFNDYTSVDIVPELGALNQDPLTFVGWAEKINNHLLQQQDPSRYQPASEIARSLAFAVIAFRRITKEPQRSRVFAVKDPQRVLVEEYVAAICRLLAREPDAFTWDVGDWVAFYEQRGWHDADWSLPHVLGVGQNRDDLNISRRVASACFDAYLCSDPEQVPPVRIHQYLKGSGGWVTVRAYRRNKNGNPEMNHDVLTKRMTSDKIINLRENDVDRVFVHIVGCAENLHVHKVRDNKEKSEPVVPGFNAKTRPLDLEEAFPNESERVFIVPVQSYHSRSADRWTLTLNW